jgi:hypothetical protein
MSMSYDYEDAIAMKRRLANPDLGPLEFLAEDAPTTKPGKGKTPPGHGHGHGGHMSMSMKYEM